MSERDVMPEPTLPRAAFMISIDTEMAWGLNHKPSEVYSYPDERPHLARLVELFDRYEIPATFAVVGHLLLDECSPVDGQVHPEIVRPDYDWLTDDWFVNDPGTGADGGSTWYAPDLIPLITGGSAGHEVASHGFSHVMAGEPGCSRETFASELRASVDAAAAHGITLRSLIYPRNSVGHVDLLPEFGFTSYRGGRPRQPTGRVGAVIDRTVGSERTAIRPRWEQGLWNLPASLMFNIDRRTRTWRAWTWQANRRLAQAVGRRAISHVWFHPHDLRQHPEVAFAALETILRAAARHRDAGRLDCLTMADTAERLSAEARPTPA